MKQSVAEVSLVFAVLGFFASTLLLCYCPLFSGAFALLAVVAFFGREPGERLWAGLWLFGCVGMFGLHLAGAIGGR